MNGIPEQKDGLVVPSRTGGPLSYQNWVAAKNGSQWCYAQEFPLFTDAWLTGSIPEKQDNLQENEKRPLGPYAVFNVVADREHAETVVGAVLRVAMHLDLSPKVDGSINSIEESAYHAGGMNDEIAALLSLCLGVRFRPGKCIRDFFPRALDQRGTPRLFDLSEVPVTRRRGKRMVVPSAAGPACLIRKTALLERYVDMTPKDATVLVKTARSYQEAMWLAEIQPELTWLLLVQAVETAANHWAKCATSNASAKIETVGHDARLLADLRKLGLTENQVEGVAELIAPKMGATRKFLGFLVGFLPPPHVLRPPAIAQVDWSPGAMKNVLKSVYQCRCNAVHEGQPFPSIMCEAPRQLIDGHEERPSCSAAQVYGATWTGDDIPILLHTFEYIVREALLKWWQSMLPVKEDIPV